MKYKKCNKCCKILPVSEFHKRSDTACGYKAYCKNCRSIKKKQFYLENKEKINDCNNVYYAKNVEKVRRLHNEYRLDNLEAARERGRYYYRNNKDRYKMHKRRRRARKVGLQERWSVEDTKWLYKTFHNRCFKCNSRNDLTIDHLKPLSKGYSLSRQNAVLLCRSCNSSKQDKIPHQFFTQKELQILLSI